MGYWYRVHTETAATIRETWTIRSRAPLSRAELETVLEQAGSRPGLAVACCEEETAVDEGARQVLAIQRVGATGES